MRDFVVIF
jgi:hypothetical protein